MQAYQCFSYILVTGNSPFSPSPTVQLPNYTNMLKL